MKEKRELVRLSKYAGERFDIVQGSGGNLSVKLDTGIMLIKESGFSLSELELERGYTKISLKKVLNILHNSQATTPGERNKRDRRIEKLISNQSRKPSIEVFLHALLYKYTLHVHPLVVNAVTCRKDWRRALSSLFVSSAAFVDYKTPGIELAITLNEAIAEYCKKYGNKPKLIFLQNHGLIVSSDESNEIIKLIEATLNKLERYLGIDLKKYKLVSKISKLVNSLENTSYVAYFSSDSELNNLIKKRRELFSRTPFCPDVLVFCGIMPLRIKNLYDKRPLLIYRKKFFGLPKVVIFNKNIFFIAPNLKKAKEIEDVFKAHILTLSFSKKEVNFLKKDELLYLNNWEAEKNRQAR